MHVCHPIRPKRLTGAKKVENTKYLHKIRLYSTRTYIYILTCTTETFSILNCLYYTVVIRDARWILNSSCLNLTKRFRLKVYMCISVGSTIFLRRPLQLEWQSPTKLFKFKTFDDLVIRYIYILYYVYCSVRHHIGR